MPELRVKATELVDAKVDFVSLVKRGANRIPFRIVKQEDEPMLDLHKIGLALFTKSETAAPEIVAAIVPVGADINKVAEIFAGAGLDTKVFVKTEVDGVVTLAKADADKASDTVIIKTSDKIGLVVSGVKKAFDSYNGTSGFSEAVKAQGFYPSFCTAKDVLSDCIHVALHKSNNPAEASEKIAKTVEDFRDYVSALAAALPATAFYIDRYYSDFEKAETAVADPVEKAAETEEDKVKAAAEKAKAAEVAKSEEEPKTEPAPVVAEVVKTEEPKTEPKADASVDITALQKSQEELLAAVTAIQKTVTTAVTGLQEEVRKEVADLATRVEKVAEQAKKTDAALNGTVFAEADGDKPNLVQKQDEGSRGAPPLLDTAYDRRAVA